VVRPWWGPKGGGPAAVPALLRRSRSRLLKLECCDQRLRIAGQLRFYPAQSPHRALAFAVGHRERLTHQPHRTDLGVSDEDDGRVRVRQAVVEIRTELDPYALPVQTNEPIRRAKSGRAVAACEDHAKKGQRGHVIAERR